MKFVFDPIQPIGRWLAEKWGHDARVTRLLRPLYEKILLTVHGDRGIPWSINGLPVRIDPRCRQSLGRDYDPAVAEFIASRVQPGDTCFDVGANVGAYVLQFAHWVGPHGRVFAFEPNPVARKTLKRHLCMNGIADRVEIIPAAVADQAGERELYFSGASGMSRLDIVNPALADSKQVTKVETTTLDLFCESRGIVPDWIVIDIEGYELQALKGAVKLLARAPNVKIIVEMHPPHWATAGTSVPDFEEFLKRHDLRADALSGQKDLFGQHGSIALTPEAPIQ